MRERVVTPIGSLNFGVHYGCHYTKPSHAHGHFDDPSCPTTLDELIRSTGAKTIEYPNKNLCCGLTVMGVAEDLSYRLASDSWACDGVKRGRYGF